MWFFLNNQVFAVNHQIRKHDRCCLLTDDIYLFVDLFVNGLLSYRWMSDEMFQAITPMVLEKHPNTYTFTKAVAENLLAEERGSLPVAIFRPSIVTGSFQEPFPVGDLTYL